LLAERSAVPAHGTRGIRKAERCRGEHAATASQGRENF
jgi:hypothetical protein